MIEREWLMSSTGARLVIHLGSQAHSAWPKTGRSKRGGALFLNRCFETCLSPSFHFVHVLLEIVLVKVVSSYNDWALRVYQDEFSLCLTRDFALSLRLQKLPIHTKWTRHQRSQLGPETPATIAGCAFCRRDQSMLTQILRLVESVVMIVQSPAGVFSPAETGQW